MKDHGVATVRYRGPYPTEQLFTALLECFRYAAGEGLPLERFLADGALDWHPAPFEAQHVRPGSSCSSATRSRRSRSTAPRSIARTGRTSGGASPAWSGARATA